MKFSMSFLVIVFADFDDPCLELLGVENGDFLIPSFLLLLLAGILSVRTFFQEPFFYTEPEFVCEGQDKFLIIILVSIFRMS